MSKEIREN